MHPPSPFDRWLGIEVTALSPTRAEASVRIDPEKHHQPYGVVHGGLYATLVETLASLGAWASAHPEGLMPVGVENHTSFLARVSGGTIRAEAEAVHRGRRTQVWEVRIHNDSGRLVARGTCRVFLLPAERRDGQ